MPWSPPVPDEPEVEAAVAPAARPPSVPRSVLRVGKRVGRAVGYGAWRVCRRLARPVVRPVREAVRGLRSRASANRQGQDGSPPAVRPNTEHVDPRLARLADCRLVIAETPGAALAAIGSGVPRNIVWLLAIPPERSAAGEPAGWAGQLREAAPQVGGLIADSLDAAGVLERVAGSVRTVVFPPLAADQSCPDCRTSTFDDPADLDPFPVDVSGHLRLWRALLAQQPPEPLPYSYAIARLRGQNGPWLASERDSWGQDPSAGRVPLDPGAPDAGDATWTAAAQLSGARALLSEVPAHGTEATPDEPVRVRVFGHDMKFMRDLAGVLGERPDLDVAIDEWRSAGARNNGITENLARTGQVLVAEWARPNAIWLSETKRPDQRLIVRLHRFEIESSYPQRIQIENVDAVVYIAPLMGQRIRAELGWPEEKLVYIPNYVDLARLDRPKFPGARFTLGMVGAVPGLKRFDLALDLLAEVRREDPRFSLLVRTQMGWAHKPSWEDPAERRELQRSLERVEKDPLLRGAVVFDAFGPDMAAWLRKVGHILSLSDIEGSHQALTEGMATGAVPVLRGWHGAAAAYGDEWIAGSLPEAATQVLATADPAVWSERSKRAQQEVNVRFDQHAVVAAWTDLVAGRVDAARDRFG